MASTQIGSTHARSQVVGVKSCSNNSSRTPQRLRKIEHGRTKLTPIAYMHMFQTQDVVSRTRGTPTLTRRFTPRRSADRSGVFSVRASEEEASASEPAATLDPEAQQDAQDIADVRFVLQRLRETRDMSEVEVKLIITIEDPREKERMQALGIEDESGVSKDDLGLALQQVIDEEVPTDRLALRKLAEDMRAWPYLEIGSLQPDDGSAAPSSPSSSPYAGITDTGVEVDTNAQQEDKDSPLPDWMGYGALYLVSVIPVIIVLVTIAILFVNSLQ